MNSRVCAVMMHTFLVLESFLMFLVIICRMQPLHNYFGIVTTFLHVHIFRFLNEAMKAARFSCANLKIILFYIFSRFFPYS